MLQSIKTQLLLILTIVITSTTYGQSYLPVEITFTDGGNKSGLAKIPDGSEKRITFKATEEGDKEKIDSEKIDLLTFTTESGRKHSFERNFSQRIWETKDGEIGTRVSKKSGWFYIDKMNNALNFYIVGQKYKLNKNEGITIISKGQAGFAGIGYYFKRPGEENATYITAKMSGFQVMHEKLFRAAASYYLKDDEQLANKIKNKEFNSSQLDEIYELYVGKK